MSAYPWENLVPYQEDVEGAFRAAQQDVFERKAFCKPYADIDFLDGMGFFEASEEERNAMIEQYEFFAFREPIKRMGISGFRDWLEVLNASPFVATREELDALYVLDETGTRSILDMKRVVDKPKMHCISPLPSVELRRLFGTECPTRAMIENGQIPAGLYESISRGFGVYFLIYDADVPVSIFFIGYSFD